MGCVKDILPVTLENLQTAPVGSWFRVHNWTRDDTWECHRSEDGTWAFDCDWFSRSPEEQYDWMIHSYTQQPIVGIRMPHIDPLQDRRV